MRCEQHDLALGPEGECVLCLRHVRRQGEQRARAIALGGCILVIAAGGVWFATRSSGATAVVDRPDAATVAALQASLSAAEPPLAAPTATLEAPLNLAQNQPDLPVSELVPAPSTNSPVPVVSAPPPGVKMPTERELLAAVQATPVVMFSTTWCKYCERARRFFRERGMSVLDHDIEQDARAAAELERRSGGRAVPLIDVDGQQLRGFDERRTLHAVADSVERRLGMSDVKLSVTSVLKRGD